MRGGLDVSFLVPCRNEASILDATWPRLRDVLDACEREGLRAELVFEEDGCSDATPQMLDSFAETDARVRVVHGDRALGKGGALTAAAAAARGRWLVTLDADVPVDAASVRSLLGALSDGADVAIASRRHRDSIVEGLPATRQVPSQVFNLLARALTPIGGVRDTQCGVKAWTKDAFEAARPVTVQGYAADVESIGRAMRAGFRVEEVPVRYTHGEERGFSVAREAPRMLADLLRIRKALRTVETPSAAAEPVVD